jgi:hypothetical protein
MGKTWQGQHIKGNRCFQQKNTHCNKKKVLKGFCELAHLKMMVMKKMMMSKTNTSSSSLYNKEQQQEGEHINFSCNHHTQ